jgi:hypothetical protein
MKTYSMTIVLFIALAPCGLSQSTPPAAPDAEQGFREVTARFRTEIQAI